ncbi:hypothetical protein BH11PLA2_BH11PLA2_48440 [soil metagenome]
MNKKHLSERDICSKFITPAVVAAGWDLLTQIREELSHRDLGQMQIYVNHYDREVKMRDENPTVGILLCKRKKDALIELTLPKNANIFASQYEFYLPTKDDLRQRLLQWTAEVEARA